MQASVCENMWPICFDKMCVGFDVPHCQFAPVELSIRSQSIEGSIPSELGLLSNLRKFVGGRLQSSINLFSLLVTLVQHRIRGVLLRIQRIDWWVTN